MSGIRQYIVSLVDWKRVVSFFFGIRERPHDGASLVDVTVVIPAYNEEGTIRATIESVKAQTYPVKEIIVVDDASSDRTGDIARECGVTVIRTPINTGSKSRAQNYAIDYVKTEYFVTLDADTILEPHAIERIVPYIRDGKTLSACGFVVPQVIRTFWEKARTVEYVYGLSLMKIAQEHVGTPLVSSGCFSIFNKELFEKAGRFPEGNIAEDMALTWKAHLMGFRIRFVPEAVCYPKDPENWIQYKRQVLRWYRGFFQCVKDIGWNIVKNKKLAVFVIVYSILGLLSIPLVLGLLFVFPYLSIPIIGLVLFDVLIGYVFSLYGAAKIGVLKVVAIYYPLLFVVTLLNSAMFIYSGYKELVVGEKLSKWEKGH